MESFNIKDFEKPYQIITENEDDFNELVRKMSLLTQEKL